MNIKSYIETPVGFQVVEVEVKLMAGLPQLHIVGQPDAHIKECGLRIKSALKSSGFSWPKGRQIVVNLRPTYLRKHSRGLDLAIVVGILIESGAAPKDFIQWCEGKVFYGEIGLGGEVFAPSGAVDLVRPNSEFVVVSGEMNHPLLEGQWWQVKELTDLETPQKCERTVDWSKIFARPELGGFNFNEEGAELLKVSSLMGMSVLLAGPQGSGKSTFAKAIHALSAEPDPEQFRENLRLTGVERKWRALEMPHHTTPAKAMVGGGSPLKVGVISKAHGGVLIMDEFLHFAGEVLESLREPLETGKIHLNRVSDAVILPAAFQLVATTNLCPCGKRIPGVMRSCGYSLGRCRSVVQRLSGPMLDRFELVGFSNKWRGGVRLGLDEILQTIEKAREFQKCREYDPLVWPQSVQDYPTSFRRKRALMRAARALADLDGSKKIQDHHLGRAKGLAWFPIDKLIQMFA